MPFLLKITPPLTFSSSEPLVENVVSVVSVVSQNRILGKNRYLFLHSQSPVFFLLKVLVSFCSEPRSFLSKSLFPSSQSPCFLHLRFPFPSSSDSRARPPQSPVSSPPLLRFPSHPLRVLSHPLKVLSLPPPPPSQRKQRNDTKPSRRSWLVPKWNIVHFSFVHISQSLGLNTW